MKKIAFITLALLLVASFVFAKGYYYGGAGKKKSAAKVYTAWNPDDKHANITLSNGNLTATINSGGAGWYGARSTLSQTAGKWYFEVTASVYSTNVTVGVANSSQSLADKWTVNAWSLIFGSGNKACATTAPAGAAYDNVVPAGSTIGIAYNATTGKLWCTDEAGAWMQAGDPANDANPMCDSISGTLFIWFAGFNNLDVVTLNVGESAFAYTVPTGFNSGWYN